MNPWHQCAGRIACNQLHRVSCQQIDKMPPTLALLLWLVLLVALLCFDPAKEPGTSPALWITLIWMFIVGSRLPSQWLGIQLGWGAQVLEEGNPVDRAIFFGLIVLAIGVLVLRWFNWGNFFAKNMALIALLSFALVSVAWSDFPFVAFKRWFRDLGDYLVILVVISDPHPLEAARTVLRRLCYFLIPLSVLLTKYYPYLSMHYGYWSGAAEYIGAATSKNMLGVMCLVSGTFFFWDTVTRWPSRKVQPAWKIIFINIAFIAMTVWLLSHAQSATSRVCLALSCLVITAAHTKWSKRHPAILKVVIPASFCIYQILSYGFNINADLAGAIGRDPTLTGRTDIWKAVLSTKTNWLVGVGYESFWLGPRLNLIWPSVGQINEAHNGYLEVYLSLGLVGVFLLGVFLISSYRTICKRLAQSCSMASLALALWTVLLFYNMAESAAFKGQLLWIIFVLVMITLSAWRPIVREAAPVEKLLSKKSPTKLREGVAV
jgi:exopolysaccharide production protein ExoQ